MQMYHIFRIRYITVKSICAALPCCFLISCVPRNAPELIIMQYSHTSLILLLAINMELRMQRASFVNLHRHSHIMQIRGGVNRSLSDSTHSQSSVANLI